MARDNFQQFKSERENSKNPFGEKGFRTTKEGAKIEAPPSADCKRCAHFKTCGVWRTCASIEQQYQEPKLTDFFKTLPKICPNYDSSLGADLA